MSIEKIRAILILFSYLIVGGVGVFSLTVVLVNKYLPAWMHLLDLIVFLLWILLPFSGTIDEIFNFLMEVGKGE